MHRNLACTPPVSEGVGRYTEEFCSLTNREVSVEIFHEASPNCPPTLAIVRLHWERTNLTKDYSLEIAIRKKRMPAKGPTDGESLCALWREKNKREG